MPRPRPPPGFITIGDGLYTSLARTSSTPASSTRFSVTRICPRVILIFGWMGAHLRHLQNYTRSYTELYPNATQILVKCDPSFLWSSESAKQRRLLPVVEALGTLGCLPPKPDSVEGKQGLLTGARPRVLVHAFSNGGSTQLTVLGRLLSTKYPSPIPPPQVINALVLDSCPAAGNVSTIKTAFSIAIRNRAKLYFVLALIYIAHAIRLALSQVFGKQMMIMEYLKLQLFKPRILPWMAASTPRLYIFSKGDVLVPWKEVLEHAEASKEKGLNVHCEMFEESGHVAHMRQDPKRYWRSVQDIWDTACRHVEDQNAA
ncbi:hypothetical protein F5I97DRAFT_1811979 [Phlebopus sp. FC_14]|nr:hypothetical protein F5I97DRAFT_1811979 [Phlebopus sp. FC_14]